MAATRYIGARCQQLHGISGFWKKFFTILMIVRDFARYKRVKYS
jgi:hypothetical protein